MKMVHGLEEINRKISTQFKLLELAEMETEWLMRNEKSEIEKHLQHVELKLQKLQEFKYSAQEILVEEGEMRIWKSGWVLWKTKFLMIFEKFWRFIDVVHSLKSAISNVEKKEAAKGKHEENIFQEEMLRRRMQEELKIQEMKLQMKSKEWMKYLLFHNRNLQFALILNTIYSTKLNCKRIWNRAIANG